MPLHLYRHLALLLALLTSVTLEANAQNPYFERVSTSNMRIDASTTKHVRKFSFYTLKEAQLRAYLAKAPLEYTKGATAIPLQIPLPNGIVETFDMVESPVLAPEVAAKHPEIKTYNGRGQTHKNYTISISFTALGFNAIILGVESDAVYFDKVSNNQANQLYMTYFGRDAERPKPTRAFGQNNKCGSVDLDKPTLPNQIPDKGARKAALLNNTGTVIRSFRLALAANAEFTQQPAYRGDVNLAFAGLVGYVNRMKAVYRAELSIEFVLVSDVTAVYSNTATDPYTNSDQGKMLDENQANLDALIGNANYDVGHVLGTELGSGGGVAVRGSVCDASTKGQGVSGVGDGSFAPIFDDQLLCHEVGHQFNMSHTYNSSLPVCTTRAPETSVEPGAGVTIMSYGFTCSEDPNDDNYEQPAYGPFLNFHTVSFEQAEAYIATISCFTSRPLENTVPVITMPANRTIPKSTPFSLSGSATDDDAALTYSWEGTNIGTIVPNGTTLANTAQPPFFRSYEPVSTGTRTFPRLGAILDGSNYAKGDKLPSVGIVTTHRLTVRDGFGGVAYKEMTVTVAGNSGPFLETTNLAGSYMGGTAKTITWDVANTTAPPVSCATVNILLSTDGGVTFPTTLVANTPNDGSESVTLPNLSTSQARIKIASSNNIFFDISNTNFAIGSGVPIVGLTAPDSIATESGGSAMALQLKRGQAAPKFSQANDLPEGDYAVFRFARDNADERLTVRFEITGSAVGDDFLTFADTVSFEVGELEFDLLVFPGDDLLSEGDETLTLTLVDEPEYDVDPTDEDATILIKDNDSSTPPGPNSLTITSFNCFSTNGALSSVNFVVGYGNGSFTPAVAPLLIVGVTGNGQLGQTYGFSGFDGGVSTLSVQDQASNSTYFVWNFRQACGTTSQPPVTPPGPSSLTITSFNCFSTNGALSSVNFVVGYGNGTFTPAVAPLLIVGVTGNGQLGQTYGFSSFDGGVSTLSVQDQASNSTYFVWDFRQACGAASQPPVTPPGPSSLTITSFNCFSTNGALSSVNFVVGYGNGTFTPAVAPLLIVGVTGNGQLGQTYGFSGFDGGVSTLNVQDQASNSTYFVWDFRQACSTGSARLGTSEGQSWEAVVLGNPPVNEYAEIELRNAMGQKLHLSLIDMAGHMLSEQPVLVNEATQRVRVRLSKSAGVYLLRVSDQMRQQTLRLLRP